MPAPQGYNMDGDSNGDGNYDTHFVRTNHFKLRGKPIYSLLVVSDLTTFRAENSVKNSVKNLKGCLLKLVPHSTTLKMMKLFVGDY